MSTAFIGIGSNIEPEDNVRKALRLLSGDVDIVAISTFYLTEPIGRPEQSDYYNGVVEIETGIPVLELHRVILKRIENDLGRVWTEDQYAARTIDLDILLYDDIVLREDDLVVPDPEIVNRAFLALQLYELAPRMVLPDTGKSIMDIVRDFSDVQMNPLTEYTQKLRSEILSD